MCSQYYLICSLQLWHSEFLLGKHYLHIHVANLIFGCVLLRFAKISTRQVWWRSWKKRTRSTPTWFQRSSRRSWRLWDAECSTFRKWQQNQRWVGQMFRSWRRRSGPGFQIAIMTPHVTKFYPPICRLKKSTCRLIRWLIRRWWEMIPWMTSWRCTGSRWGL